MPKITKYNVWTNHANTVNIGPGWYGLSNENIGLFKSMKELKVCKKCFMPQGKKKIIPLLIETRKLSGPTI